MSVPLSNRMPADVWWPFTHAGGPNSNLDIGHNVMPHWVGLIARPLLVAVCVTLPLVFARRVRQDLLGRVLPLLALVLLVRCMLDPLDNSYYHVPFLFALVAADAMSGTFAATLVATTALYLTPHLGLSPDGLWTYYMAWTVPFAAYLALRTRDARGPGAAPSSRSSEGDARTRTAI